MSTDSQLIGAAGEHLVLSRLLVKGMLAAQAPRGTRKADILVNHLDGKAPCLIQVKARSGKGSDISWHMNKKHEEIDDHDMYYCFVDFGNADAKVYVVPASRVAEVVRESHATWLAAPGKQGQPHNSTDMRRIRANYGMGLTSAPDGWLDDFLENWDLIETHS